MAGVSCHIIFVFAPSQFRGPNYLGAWNRLSVGDISETKEKLIDVDLKDAKGIQLTRKTDAWSWSLPFFTPFS